MFTAPKTDWAPDNLIGEDDINRIETNISHIYSNTHFMSGNYVDPSGANIQYWTPTDYMVMHMQMFSLDPGQKILIEKVAHTNGLNAPLSNSDAHAAHISAYNGTVLVGDYLCHAGTAESPIYGYSNKFANETLFENDLVAKDILVKVQFYRRGTNAAYLGMSWGMRLAVI